MTLGYNGDAEQRAISSDLIDGRRDWKIVTVGFRAVNGSWRRRRNTDRGVASPKSYSGTAGAANCSKSFRYTFARVNSRLNLECHRMLGI